MASNTGCVVGDRLADDLQYLGRGGLPLQRLLRLVEQPRVLDRDHRLVGEGLQQRHLFGLNAPLDRATPMAPMPRSFHSIGAKAIER